MSTLEAAVESKRTVPGAVLSGRLQLTCKKSKVKNALQVTVTTAEIILRPSYIFRNPDQYGVQAVERAAAFAALLSASALGLPALADVVIALQATVLRHDVACDETVGMRKKCHSKPNCASILLGSTRSAAGVAFRTRRICLIQFCLQESFGNDQRAHRGADVSVTGHDHLICSSIQRVDTLRRVCIGLHGLTSSWPP